MSTVTEIEATIERMPSDELRALVNWIEEYAAAIGAHEKVAAEAPPTDSSEQLAAQQIDKSYSSLKAALAGMIKSRKKGDLNAFALYKQQAIDALNQLSKQASLVRCISCFQSGLDTIGGIFLGVFLWDECFEYK